MQQLESLRALLENEVFPQRYTHKFIGHKTDAFAAAVEALEQAFPRAQRVLVRESGMASGGRYLAYTYEIEVGCASEIIDLIQATSAMQDLKLIL